MILSISWRNVWRNKLRSSVILSAVAIGIFAGVFIWAFYAGMVNQRIETAIATEASNIQIHPKGYLEDPDVKNYIQNSHQIIEDLKEKYPEIQGVSERILVNGMAMSAEQGTGVLVMGIEPENEKQVTNISEKIKDGAYFEGIKRNPIVIGQKMAEKLNLKVRSKIVVTLQQMDGTMTRAQFRVAGIYKITNSMYEELNVFVRSKDLEKILNAKSNFAHEIAIKLNDNDAELSVYESVKSDYINLEVKTWRELMPEVSIVEETMDLSMIVFMIIVLVGLCLAIINTMLMSVLERVKELGMLMAVGMNKKRVFGMIVYETIFLAITGTVIGIIIAGIISVITGYTGINLAMGSEAYEMMGYDSIIYPTLNAKMIISITVMVVVASILSAIYPAIKALKLNPAEATRSDM